MATRVVAAFTAGLAGNLDNTAQFAMADKNGATRRFTLAQVRTALAAGTQLLTGDLTFTDATYDIGKTGATRPRDGFFSRNLVVGGAGTFSGAVAANTLSVSSTATFGETRSNSGTISSNTSGVAATAFTASSAGTYLIWAQVSNSGVAYHAFAIVTRASGGSGGTALKEAWNGANLTITVSGSDVQITQSSGSSNIAVAWRYLLIN